MTDEGFLARLRLLRALALAAAGILSLRLVDLQILRADEFAFAASRNAVQLRTLRAPRGRILDRAGRVLATERLSYEVVYVAAGTPRGHEEATAARLSGIFGETAAVLSGRLKGARRAPLRPVVLARDVAVELVERIAWDGPFLPGVQIQPSRARIYPAGPLLAHLLGYVAEAGPAEVAGGYSMGDVLGVAGVEARYEPVLRGKDGFEAVEVDVIGQPLRIISRVAPRPGADLVLAADAEIAAWAREALSGRRGAVVVDDPRTGEVLALISSPDFDPNAFADRNRTSDRLAFLHDDTKPMLNRAVASGYPPGSTFKVVTMTAGLRTGALGPHTAFTCRGVYAGKKCWNKSGHGTLDLVDGFAQSCDVYFYHSGEAVGIEAMAETARLLGLERRPDLGLGGEEEEGIAPTPEWERTHVAGPDGRHWGLGDLLNTAIGQGYVLATPFHVARFFGAAALAGRLMRPVLALRAVDGDSVADLPVGIVEGEAFLSDTQAGIVRAAMRAVTERGTAGRLRIEGVPIGAKTGTAQNPHGDDHAWIVAAAPMPEPRVVIAVLLENAGHGSSAAGPVARRILERLAVREGWTAEGPASHAPPRDGNST